MNKKLTITRTVSYDYVIFDGSNYDEVRDFVERHYIYGNGSIEESFHIRPAEIPNLDEDELFKWWESTGEVKEEKRGFQYVKYNTHNHNNLPYWRKDEMILVECRCGQDGWLEREFMEVGTAIIWVNDKWEFVKMEEDKIEDFVREIVM